MLPRPVKGKDVTRLAKTIHASHLIAGGAVVVKRVRGGKPIPWDVVESLWDDATSKERDDYRFEARQVLGTLALEAAQR